MKPFYVAFTIVTSCEEALNLPESVNNIYYDDFMACMLGAYTHS